MSKETTERNNQAEQLKRIFDELQQNTFDSEELLNDQFADDDSPLKIDVLNLPPRNEVHGNDNARIRMSIGKPLIRFLSVIILIVAIICGAYFIWGDDLITIINGLR